MSPPLPSPGKPAAEVPIDAALVRKLLAEQHPDLADLPLREVEAGWDNAMFRLGERFAVRLPRRALAAPLVVHEQTWLPRLATHFSLPVPLPERVGMPARGYPWRWSVVRWIAGRTADECPPLAAEATRLANFLQQMHRPAPDDAPRNPFRGMPLAERAAGIMERFHRLAQQTPFITPAIEHAWQQAVAAPVDVPPTWLHGDLHPRNVLVEQGQISGIIDWGDLTAGDCATDLASVWMLFADPAARRAAFAVYGPLTAATFTRAKGWAIFFGAMLLESGRVNSPAHAAMGECVLRRLAEPDADIV